MAHAQEVVNGLRNIRAEKNIPNREQITVNVIGSWDNSENAIIAKLANVAEIKQNAEKDAASASFIAGSVEINVPLSGNIDTAAELDRLNKDLEYTQGFLASVQKKLSNERFVANAPAQVVEAERKKLADAHAKIESLTKAIEALTK